MGWSLDAGLQEGVQDAEQAEAGRNGRGQPQEARLEVLPAVDRSLPHRAKPELDGEPTRCPVLVVLVQVAAVGSLLQGKVCPEWEAQQKIRWAEAWKKAGKEAGRGKSRFKIRDLLTDGRCSQAVLDFLSTTDVGRLAPAEVDAGSEVSEWEQRERREQEEERGAEGGRRPSS